MIDLQHHTNKGIKSLFIGLVLSIITLLAAYYLAVEDLFSNVTLVIILMGIALLQGLFQLIFFMHLGRESRPRWGLMTFFFSILVLVIIVTGSIWIMYNLKYNLG